MKHFLIFLTLIFTSLSGQAQFTQTIGSPDFNFQATQIRTLTGDTYVSGWLTNPNAANPPLSTEGVIVRMDATGVIDWIYQLSDNTQTVTNGTRIYDFDFDDAEGNIVFVGSTSPTSTVNNNPVITDNQCILGMVDITSGAGVFQETYDFRPAAREFFLRIENHPGTVPANTYIISGLINDGTLGAIDNYISCNVEITPAVRNFNWINENHYQSGTQDEEMYRMGILEVQNSLQIVYAGVSISNARARLNFHDIVTGNLINEFNFDRNGTVTDVAQIGNMMLVVGRIINNNSAFISCVDLQNFSVTSSLEFNSLSSFSRLEVDPNNGNILAVGERSNDNSAICRFSLNGNQLIYSNASVFDFGMDGPGNGFLTTEGNDAFFADTRTMLPTFGANQSALVVRTNLDLVTCNTDEPIFTPQPINLSLISNQVMDETALMVPNPVNLALDQDPFCTISLCGSGFNLNTVIPVFHNSRSHYVNVADIDGDGWDDFAVPDIGFAGTPRFSLSENNQNLTFTNTPSTSINPGFDRDGESMEFFDLDNGDGELDIVIQRFGSVEVYINSSTTGTYTLMQSFDVTVATPPNASNLIGI